MIPLLIRLVSIHVPNLFTPHADHKTEALSDKPGT
jgi:hypothetical protein